jgi:hypothetical protein
MFSFALRARISRPTYRILSELSPPVKRPDIQTLDVQAVRAGSLQTSSRSDSLLATTPS